VYLNKFQLSQSKLKIKSVYERVYTRESRDCVALLNLEATFLSNLLLKNLFSEVASSCRVHVVYVQNLRILCLLAMHLKYIWFSIQVLIIIMERFRSIGSLGSMN